MSHLLTKQPPGPASGEENDPFRYGWRYVPRPQPDGQVLYEEVPLTWEDLLYPEEGDFVVQEPPHNRDVSYLFWALEARYHDRPGVVVLSDSRVDWGVREVRPLGPDIVTLFGVREWRQQGTFRVREEGGRPVLVMEATSPDTYVHDMENKPPLFFKVGVEWLVIVDRGPAGEDPVRLHVYRRGPENWVPVPPNEQGRYYLGPLDLYIGIEEDRPWLYDAPTGLRLPDPVELTQARSEAEARAQEETRARAEAEARAQHLQTKVQEEARARANAETKAQEEAQACAEAETKAREEAQARAEAETKAQEEARARAEAEIKAREEAQARAALEERLRQLEEQVRRQAGDERSGQ